MKQAVALTIAALALVAPTAAQQETPRQRATFESMLQVERARAAVESRVTTGAPYSGEAVTETTQALADGNRIARKSVTRIFRDSEGRTRRETLSTTGEVVAINISDPVGESQYVLDPRTKTAHRNGVIMMGRGGGFAAGSVRAGGSGVVVATRSADGNVSVRASDPELKARQEAELAAQASAGARGGGGGGGGGRGGGAGAGQATAVPPMIVAPAMAAGGGKINKEDLGTQIVEGVMATGTRTTLTIEAGAIGNVQPIHVVSEQWYSEDLKVLIMTRHSDPRSGDTTYRLTNINLAEPHRSQFEVPPDYTLKDSVIRRENPLK